MPRCKLTNLSFKLGGGWSLSNSVVSLPHFLKTLTSHFLVHLTFSPWNWKYSFSPGDSHFNISRVFFALSTLWAVFNWILQATHSFLPTTTTNWVLHLLTLEGREAEWTSSQLPGIDPKVVVNKNYSILQISISRVNYHYNGFPVWSG